MKCTYAPNVDARPEDKIEDKGEVHEIRQFFRTVFNDENEDGYVYKIITGDFNVALEHEKYMSGYIYVNNPHSREIMKRKIKLCGLVGIWRERNPIGKEFTFNKR